MLSFKKMFVLKLFVICGIFKVSSESNLDQYPIDDELLSNTNHRFQQIMQGAGHISELERKQPIVKVDVKAEIDKLNSSYVYQTEWPDRNKKLGSVTAVSFDVDGNVVIFHRVDRLWNQNTFNEDNHFQERKLGPIMENTVIAFDRANGSVIYEWGKGLFYMPHGLTIDADNNAWVTDVALHQIMKFGPRGSGDKSLMRLGTPFSPGAGKSKFCKPTAVAVLPNGEFFVADGYCNARIIKYSKTGEILLSWGQHTFQGRPFDVAPNYFFAIPHALTLANDKELVCAADRENGRIQCFSSKTGTFHSQYHSPIIGDRLFSMDYAPVEGGQLFVVNGPTLPSEEKHEANEVRGYIIDMKTKQVVSKFDPNGLEFQNPHDLAVTADGKEIYVAELYPTKIHKFVSKKVGKRMSLSITKTNETNLHETLAEHQVLSGWTIFLISSLILIIIILTIAIALLISRRRNRNKPAGAVRMSSPNELYVKLAT